MEVKIGVDAITKALAQNTLQWQNILQQSNPERKVKVSSRKQFGCDYCNRKFVYLTGLRRHVKKFHPDKKPLVPAEQTAVSAPSDMQPKTFDVVLKCKNCGQIFPDVKTFEAHSLRYNWEQLLIEGSLDTNENGMLLFAGQISIVVIHAAVACEFCDALFSDYASLFYHEAHHTPASGYACTFCKLNFPNMQAVLDHRAQCYECINFRTTRLLNVCILYSCNSCMATFATLPELYEHRYSNHHYFPRRNVALSRQDAQLDGLWLSCEICGFTIDNIYELFNHRNKVHSVAGIGERGVTEKPASTQRAVKRANKEESDHCRQFLCDKCGKTYTQSSHLWQHLRFHNGIRPFVCTVQGCTRRFTIRPDLNDHVRKCHTGERPYECDVCHKRFLTGSVYYQHRLIHRNERRHACNDCDRRFYRADALKNHRRIHTGEKPYACTHCDRKFRQRGDREKHVRVKHMKYR